MAMLYELDEIEKRALLGAVVNRARADLNDGQPLTEIRETKTDKTITLTERELFVIINALNYAKGEWATCEDEELIKLSDDADTLEMRPHQEQEKLNVQR